MIFYIWFSDSFFYFLLLPFSWLYGFITIVIRYAYDIGVFKVYKFPVPILIIGNLTIGGNGKTPMVLWLVEHLQSRGWVVGVVSRGYGGKSKRYPLILDSSINSSESGDEPLLIWQRTGAPIAVAPKRAEAVAALLKKYTLDIIISDDGLQHYSLARDIEWVVVSNRNRFGNGWWIPAGPMRERVKRLNTVQAVIVNGGSSQLGEIQMKLCPDSIVNILSGERKSLSFLSHGVVAMAGIADPVQFFSTLRSNGVKIIREIIFADHQVYVEKTLNKLVMDNEILLMTEKDAVKCHEFAHANWWSLRIHVVMSKNVTERLLSSVEKLIFHYNSHRVPYILYKSIN